MAKAITFDEDVYKEFGKRTNELSQKTQDCSDRMMNDYSRYTSHGMLNETVKDLGKGFNNSSSVLASTANNFLKHGDEMFSFDRKTASSVNSMEMPQDFVGSNSSEIHSFNATILSKLDDKAVSKDKNTEEQEFDDSSIVAAKDLFDMNENENTEEKAYDDTTIIGKSVLGSVNGGDTIQKEIDESTTISNTNLNGVKDGDTKEQEFDDSTVIGESVLGDINAEEDDDEKKQVVDVDKIVAAIDGIEDGIEKDEEIV